MRRGKVVTAVTETARPNFLIIGAAKSGTTALWHYLIEHPQVYMSPRKHTRHFAYEVEDPVFQGPAPANPSVPYAIADEDAYHSLFGETTGETAIGEASHSYLYRPDAAGRIKDYDPAMKLIAILRDPAERAFSHYRQMVRDRREPLDDFVRALEAEEWRLQDRWWPDFHYVQIGLYFAQLGRYFDLFGRDQVRVYLYEDFDSDPVEVLTDIFGFLGVDETYDPQISVRYNASGIPKNEVLHQALQRFRLTKPAIQRIAPRWCSRLLLHAGGVLHNRNLTKPHLAPNVRRRVIDRYFREDVVKLQDLIQRDLATWLR